MKIALISDSLTQEALSVETSFRNITPYNYKFIFHFYKPDFLFVESAWQGYKNRWKYKIASYPDVPKRNNNKLKKVLQYAKKLNIPTVFWNKEDGVHFDRFIESAKLFDYIFTVDENCVQKYKQVVPKTTKVTTLLFAVQSKFHYFDGFHFKSNGANFVGSYSTHIHPKRKKWQDMMFQATEKLDIPLTIFDRNSDRKASHYRYPNLKNIIVKGAVPYKETAKIYKDYLISFNVNTIEDSPTMFSRRLIEIIACGGVAITNPTPAVENYFKEYCYVIHNEEELLELLKSFENGLTQEAKEKLKQGAAYIQEYHTWTHRLQEIKEFIGLK